VPSSSPLRSGFRMVARIPYPATVPKFFTVTSEVATMSLLRSFGLLVPDVYGYSPTPNNAAGTAYIFMEFVQGTNLGDIWYGLRERDIISISRQLAELESKMMAISFPAGGSLYYTEDLENVAESTSWVTESYIFKPKRSTIHFHWCLRVHKSSVSSHRHSRYGGGL